MHTPELVSLNSWTRPFEQFGQDDLTLGLFRVARLNELLGSVSKPSTDELITRIERGGQSLSLERVHLRPSSVSDQINAGRLFPLGAPAKPEILTTPQGKQYLDGYGDLLFLTLNLTLNDVVIARDMVVSSQILQLRVGGTEYFSIPESGIESFEGEARAFVVYRDWVDPNERLGRLCLPRQLPDLMKIEMRRIDFNDLEA